MKAPLKKQPLTFYLRTYRRYILPTWFFPIYFLIWGYVSELIVPKPLMLSWFFIGAGIPFLGTFIWAQIARKHIPYWPFCFLTMLVPFFIWGALVLSVVCGSILWIKLTK